MFVGTKPVFIQLNINKLMKHYKGMKKNCFYGRAVPFHLKKCLVVMKLCLFFMFVLHFGVSATGYAQQKVSLSMEDVTLEQVLKELKQANRPSLFLQRGKSKE